MVALLQENILINALETLHTRARNPDFLNCDLSQQLPLLLLLKMVM